MPRRFLKRLHARVDGSGSANPILRWAGRFAERHPRLVAFNRHTVPPAIGIGVAAAFIPLPIQTLVAVIIALPLRVNLLVTALATLVSNPLTYAPIWYAEYRVGVFVLQQPPLPQFELSIAWFQANLAAIAGPMLVGTVVFALVFGPLAWLLVRTLWVAQLQARLKRRRRLMQPPAPTP